MDHSSLTSLLTFKRANNNRPILASNFLCKDVDKNCSNVTCTSRSVTDPTNQNGATFQDVFVNDHDGTWWICDVTSEQDVSDVIRQENMSETPERSCLEVTREAVAKKIITNCRPRCQTQPWLTVVKQVNYRKVSTLESLGFKVLKEERQSKKLIPIL